MILKSITILLSVPEENVATGRHNAQVTRGEMKSALLDGDTTTYDQDRGFSRHPIDENHGNGIMVELGKPCIINTIHLLLWDKDVRYVERIPRPSGWLTSERVRPSMSHQIV